MLGMVTQLRLKIDPQFNLRVRVTYNDEASLFGAGGALAQMQSCDYGTINWFPRTKKWVKTCGTVTTSAAVSGAENVMLNPLPGFDGATGIVRNAWQSAACDRGFAVTVEGTPYSIMRRSPRTSPIIRLQRSPTRWRQMRVCWAPVSCCPIFAIALPQQICESYQPYCTLGLTFAPEIVAIASRMTAFFLGQRLDSRESSSFSTGRASLAAGPILFNAKIA